MSTSTIARPAFTGAFYDRGDPGYEAARRAAVWNGRKPDRHPDHILVAADEQDVVTGVGFAGDHDLRIGIRSGGHSVVATGVRDGGLLIDLSGLTSVQVDKSRHVAVIGPGVRGRMLAEGLLAEGLSFPFGGSPTVGLGGYLITGGYGLNGKTFGSGASNILAVDLVTPDGELIHADERTNADWLWAVRGGGYGLFGIVVRFWLRVFDAPRDLTLATYTFSVEHFEEFGDWFLHTVPTFDHGLTTLVFGVTEPGSPRNVVRLVALGFGDTAEETHELFRPVEQSSVAGLAQSRTGPAPTTIPEVWVGVDRLYPEGARYYADTCWLADLSAPGLVGALKPAFETIPTRGSHVMMNPWVPETEADFALSGTTSLPFHLYGVGVDAGEDLPLRRWIDTAMACVVPFSNGVGKINESDLLVRDQHVLDPGHVARLERLRTVHDPQHRFHTFLRAEEAHS